MWLPLKEVSVLLTGHSIHSLVVSAEIKMCVPRDNHQKCMNRADGIDWGLSIIYFLVLLVVNNNDHRVGGWPHRERALWILVALNSLHLYTYRRRRPTVAAGLPIWVSLPLESRVELAQPTTGALVLCWARELSDLLLRGYQNCFEAIWTGIKAPGTVAPF